MDETGLNFRLLPRQTYVHKMEKSVRGTKSMKSKDRVTLYIATNATGTKSAIEHDREFKKSQMLWTKTGEAKTYIFQSN